MGSGGVPSAEEKGTRMIRHLIVPIDGSTESWRAFDVALALATRARSDICVVEVAGDPVDRRNTLTRLNRELQQRGPFDVEVTPEVRLTSDSVAAELATVVSLHPDSLIVMSSHGRGRSAAIVGSVAEDVLQTTFGPVVLVGANVEPDDFSGPIFVSVDGSQESEIALPLAAAWATELDTATWIVNVVTSDLTITGGHDDGPDISYTARLAKELAAFCGRTVEFDELHDSNPARAVPEYATRHGASMIVASSHGRSGLSRLTMGSVAAGFVRNATCPVTVVRIPQPVQAEQPAHRWAY